MTPCSLLGEEEISLSSSFLAVEAGDSHASALVTTDADETEVAVDPGRRASFVVSLSDDEVGFEA